jgi:NNP family nitrate/nitrite transporter-like MFS transporter
MHLKGFLKAGHTPTLACAFLYFDISFMIWVLMAPLAAFIVPEMQLNEAQRGYLLAVAPLGGAVLRIVLGVSTDYIGPKRTGLIGMTFTILPLLIGWLWADSFAMLLLVGLMLGVAGASFAVALPMASRWYPPKYQGLALGIAGAGNSGTALATFFGPVLAKHYGWHAVFGIALIPLVICYAIFLLVARDAPDRPRPKSARDYASVLGQRDAWLFCFFYTVTFGGFLGFCLFLNSYFVGQFGLDRVTAGYLATACVVSGSFLRPIGGYLADRFSGIRVLTVLFFGIAGCMALMALALPIYLALPVMFVAMGLFGMGNGSVFQLVPLRFPREIGVLTGVAGAAGGVGGFFLNVILGNVKQYSGGYAWGFAAFSLAALACGVTIVRLGRGWIAQPDAAPVTEPVPAAVVEARSPA